ncbi:MULTISPECIES: hypothetical protein [unclassified Pseudovibrio]|uniref:hypothetical protein n=1 Tax=unclassified Pseudovibrio TaxID=2627060 RepID=UPI0007AE934B|nr:MULTISPECIES: hypothetical protein [unclassified Pseudovibrio]KZK96477.1 hypothetical protein PsAD5_02670 [Pseudovibrio sp. Ad5]KZL00408.1 hypothetical protein PsW74_02833 [Pseudovibrio sp. W74]KZL07408.1 hypothetical protein PsAD14_03793 [Pseudovibrio sp. Ad14]
MRFKFALYLAPLLILALPNNSDARAMVTTFSKASLKDLKPLIEDGVLKAEDVGFIKVHTTYSLQLFRIEDTERCDGYLCEGILVVPHGKGNFYINLPVSNQILKSDHLQENASISGIIDTIYLISEDGCYKTTVSYAPRQPLKVRQNLPDKHCLQHKKPRN